MPSPAERLLQELGVTEPDEIDLEAIAYHVGVQLRYRALDGCEARIIGYDDAAIITVNVASSVRRQRFSIAHELGHWHHHRGRVLACRVEEYVPQSTTPEERSANSYAADLVMPRYLFDPRAHQQGKLTFKVVNALAQTFDTSFTATAIRLIEGDHAPALLVRHGLQGRKWYVRAPSVAERWTPKQALDPDSRAFNILFGRAPNDPSPRKIGANVWFGDWEASRFDVHEQSVRVGDGEAITLILLSDSRMGREANHPSIGR